MKRAREPDDPDIEGPVAILWDMENCGIPNGISPEEVAGNIRKSLHMRGITGPVTTFSAYGDFSNRPRTLREGCQRSGVNLIDVSNGRKDSADKAILADMFLFALDNDPPSSILLISSDADFASALNKLGQRGYAILVALLNFKHTCSALWNAARFVWEWPKMAGNQDFGESSDQILRQKRIKVTVSGERGLPSETISGLPSETISGLNPNSSIQPSNMRLHEIDVVKDELLTLLHMNRGSIIVYKIASCYYKAFKKQFCLKKYGYKLKRLLQEMENDIYVTGEERGKYLCLQSQKISNAPLQNNVTEAVDFGSPYETTMETNLTSLTQPSNTGPGDSGTPHESKMEPNQPSSMQPSDIRPEASNLGLLSEITIEIGSTSSVQPSEIKPGDSGMPSETTTESNPISSMQINNIQQGDYQITSETAKKPNPSLLMHPSNIKLDDCGLSSEITAESNPSSLMQPSKFGSGDYGLPSETTEPNPNPNSSMQASNISPGACGLPSETTETNLTSSMQPKTIKLCDCRITSETTTQPKPSSSIQPSNIKQGDCKTTSETTQPNQFSSKQPSKINWDQVWGPGKYLCVGSQRNSNALKQNNITETGESGLPSETTSISNSTFSMQPSSSGPSDRGLPCVATTEANTSSLIQPSNISLGACGLPFPTTIKPIPILLTQQSNIRPSGIDAVKDELLTLLVKSGGGIGLNKIPFCYRQIFKKGLNLNKYGFELKTLLEDMQSDIYMQEKEDTVHVILRSQGNYFLQSQENSNAPKQNDITAQMPLFAKSGDCGLASETITKPNPTSIQSGNTRLSGIDAVKEELLMLLHRSGNGKIALQKISSCYKKTFKKDLNMKKYGYKLRKLFEEMTNDVYMEGKASGIQVLLRLQGSQKNSNAPKNNNLIETGECGLASKIIKQPNPTSSMQPSAMKQNGIDAVKDELLMLLHRSGSGRISLNKISSHYNQTFKKELRMKKYGCNLRKLFEEMGNDVYVKGQGNQTQVLLRSQGSQKNSNAPKKNNLIACRNRSVRVGFRGNNKIKSNFFDAA